jgi:glycosyltransferase involved in cell wall biosynthesis
MRPLVTIGIPTFNRSTLLRRALTAAASQDYPNLEVLVADNASPGRDTELTVDSFRDQIPRLVFTKHPENIGPLRNLQSLLDRASGDYFMWLADDDEISSNYVTALVAALELDRNAASATGHWILAAADGTVQEMQTSSYPESSALVRAIRFVWKSDDAFFYGVHRTAVLRQASFNGYVWPNRDQIANWAYVYLMDVILRGSILLANDPSVQFINHDYTSKTYAVRLPTIRGRLTGALRRLNVHALYWTKVARVLNPVSLLPIVAVSLCALGRDALATIVRRAARIRA